ncbi:MAG: lipase maturation factor family protein, partial [Terriglobia bacterium]
WLWFRIYFESGVVKMASGDPEWRHLTALYQYYSNGPLPDWIGWYAQHLPHSFNAALALLTLVTELGLVWLFFLPRRFRLVCFFLVTPFQIGIILTANLAFLNYFVLALGFLLLDDKFLQHLRPAVSTMRVESEGRLWRAVSRWWRSPGRVPAGSGLIRQTGQAGQAAAPAGTLVPPALSSAYRHAAMVISGFLLSWVFYVDTALLLLLLLPKLPLPVFPIAALEPFRIANQYGLFAVMTTARYEIEFQGSQDGKTWLAYPFLYKPQNPRQAPRIYAPYQPRFDWNLWFASLGTWRQYPFVVRTEVLLLLNDPSVLSLFAGNPFGSKPPRFVRTVTWQYWFTSLKTMRTQGLWWRRKLLGLYAPIVERLADGRLGIVQTPEEGSP